jgi:hypothetical protein
MIHKSRPTEIQSTTATGSPPAQADALRDARRTSTPSGDRESIGWLADAVAP